MKRLSGAGFIPVLFLALVLILLGGPVAARAHMRLITIGSTSSGGLYSPAAGAIAKLSNEQRITPGLRFVVEYSSSPPSGLTALMAHDLDFVVVPSDCQYQAFKGLESWEEAGPQKDLRSVFTINAETFFLVASQGSNILAYPDLKGKAVGVGDPKSGQAKNFARVMGAYGLSLEDLARAEEYRTTESAKMLEDGRIDAFVYISGNPSELILEAVTGRVQVRLVPVDEKELDALTEKYRYYTKAAIPLADYPRAMNTEDVPTVAVKASLVTSAQTPDEVVYALTRAVFGNLARFKALNQAFAPRRSGRPCSPGPGPGPRTSQSALPASGPGPGIPPRLVRPCPHRAPGRRPRR